MNDTAKTLFTDTPFDDFKREHSESGTDSNKGSDQDPPEIPVQDWPAPLNKDLTYLGIVGEYMNLVEPQTEADPAAVLIQFLVGFGSIIGRSAYYQVGVHRHHTNLFAVVVGATSKSRKGVGHDTAMNLFREIDPDWKSGGGYGSGEALIWAVHDEVEKWDAKNKQMVIIDPGVGDKRLLVSEAEYTGILKVAGRDGCLLSEVIRKIWDTGDLQNATKGSSGKASGSHISILGQVTRDELLQTLDEVSKANGFANRYLWICARRSRFLPEGGDLDTDDLAKIQSRVADAIKFAKGVGRMVRDDDTTRLWAEQYAELSEGRPGMLGAITSRAEAQVTRLSLVYALLDKSDVVHPEHLRAAMEVWRYCENSARYIFGDTLGNRVADAILAALREAGDSGLTQSDISRLILQRNVSASGVARALNVLVALNRVRKEEEKGEKGRPPTRWFAVGLS